MISSPLFQSDTESTSEGPEWPGARLGTLSNVLLLHSQRSLYNQTLPILFLVSLKFINPAEAQGLVQAVTAVRM